MNIHDIYTHMYLETYGDQEAAAILTVAEVLRQALDRIIDQQSAKDSEKKQQ